jgi:hypothetical protein
MQAAESLSFMTPVYEISRPVGACNVPAQEMVCEQLKNDITRINYIGAELGFSPMPFDLVVALQAYWNISETYYSVARQRSTGMAKNVARAATAPGADRAIAISGGFHSQDMSDWLTREGQFATLIITPAVPDSISAMKAAEYRYNRRGVEEE